VPGQNAEREHLVEHGDPAGTGEIQAPGMTMRPGPGPDTETGSREPDIAADAPVRGSGGTASARRLRLRQGVRDRAALGDARMQRLNGGATEIMKELMGRSLGL
jgi:hypothetical protein